MKYKSVVALLFLTGLLFLTLAKNAYSATTVNYGNLTLTAPWQNTSWGDVWDLTKGDLTLSYTIDMTGATQPWPWSCSWTEVGLRTEGGGNFNPGPWSTYQGACGGWMAMGYGDLTPTPNTLSLFEKFNLQASGGRDETDYDCLVPTAVVPKFGSGSNYGIWFDRDGVDPWQDDDPTTPPPGGSAVPWGSHNGQTYNTGGFYDVEIHYHAINAGLGTMFATVNGIPTGFYIVPPGYDNMQPDYYPAGLSFKGNMSRMQLFAGIWAPDATYGHVDILDLTVTGELGVSDPLVVGFTYTPPSVAVGYTIHFTDTTHGGSTPYASRAWDFNGDAITDSTLQNPTWTFLTAGDYNVKLTVTDNIGDGCCVRSLTEKITVTDFPVGGEWTPTALQTVGLQPIVQWIAVAALAAAITTAVGLRMRRKVP